MASQRTIITISDEEKAWLKGYSQTYGISMAQAIRKGIAHLRKEEGETAYKRMVKATGGIWEKGDGLQYQQKIRSEWS